MTVCFIEDDLKYIFLPLDLSALSVPSVLFVYTEKKDYFVANFVEINPISPSFTPMCFATTGHLAFKSR